MLRSETFLEWAGLPPDAEIAGWEVVPLEIDGCTAGMAALDGTEIHFALNPEWRGRAITRKTARGFLAPLLERRGYLTTRAQAPTEEQRRFLRRLGFAKTWAAGDIEHFMLCEIPFERRS